MQLNCAILSIRWLIAVSLIGSCITVYTDLINDARPLEAADELLRKLSSSSASAADSTAARGRPQHGTLLSTWRRYNEAKQKTKKERKKQQLQQQKIVKLNAAHRSLPAVRNNTGNVMSHRFADISLAAPHQLLSYRAAAAADAVAVLPSERAGNTRCSFLGAVCGMETVEHRLVQRFIRADDRVLELGARFGTTSCAISSAQRNSGLLLSVEPDAGVWNLLDENRRSHSCNFWLLRGVIADRQAMTAAAAGVLTGYATRTQYIHSKSSSSSSSNGNATSVIGNNRFDGIKNYSLEQVQKVLNITFTAVLIDCEGCINALFGSSDHDGRSSRGSVSSSGSSTASQWRSDEEAEAAFQQSLHQQLRHVRTVILEGDMAEGARDCSRDCVDYKRWQRRMNAAGLRTVHREVDPIFPKIVHYVFQR